MGHAFLEEFARAVVVAAQRAHPCAGRIGGQHEVHPATAFGRQFPALCEQIGGYVEIACLIT